MKRLKMLTVCGFGVGSSMVLKMKLDELLKSEHIDAQVETADIGSASSMPCDLIFTSKELGEKLKQSVSVPVISISNFIDKNEIRRVGLPIIKKLNKE
jgi:PTS system ascorbate-specific IIB component